MQSTSRNSTGCTRKTTPPMTHTVPLTFTTTNSSSNPSNGPMIYIKYSVLSTKTPPRQKKTHHDSSTITHSQVRDYHRRLRSLAPHLTVPPSPPLPCTKTRILRPRRGLDTPKKSLIVSTTLKASVVDPRSRLSLMRISNKDYIPEQKRQAYVTTKESVTTHYSTAPTPETNPQLLLPLIAAAAGEPRRTADRRT